MNATQYPHATSSADQLLLGGCAAVGCSGPISTGGRTCAMLCMRRAMLLPLLPLRSLFSPLEPPCAGAVGAGWLPADATALARCCCGVGNRAARHLGQRQMWRRQSGWALA